MKNRNIIMYMLSLAGMLGLWSCSTDEAIPEGSLVASGEKVPVTITISRGAQTRTELSENTINGGLNQVWSEGDVVKLYNSNGGEAGTLTLQSGASTPDGIFTGEVTGTTGNYRLWYFGKPQTDGENPYPYLDFSTAGQVKLDLQNQNFRSLDELEAVDILSTNVNIVVKGDQGTVGQTVTMAPHVAMARFTISGIPEGTSGTVKIYNNLNSDRSGIYARRSLSLSTGEQQGGNGTTASFTYDGVKNGDDIYVAFLPNPYTLHFEFETSEGAKFTYTFGQNSIEAGVYYQSFNKAEGEDTGTPEGIEVPMTFEGGDDSGDYESMGNWGLPNGLPEWTDTGDRTPTKTSSEVGWLYNQYMQIIKECYFNPITFTKNGGVDGYLYSTRYAEPSYYQWGRWLGFPKEIGIAPAFNYAGQSSGTNRLENQKTYGVNNNSVPVCINPSAMPVNSRFGYTCENFMYYTRIYVNLWDSWTVQKSIYASTVWGMDPTRASANRAYDYVVGGYTRNEKWEDRSGNPCPDGYRIPTKDELSCLVPSVTGFESHAEVKTSVSGKKYAMRWVVSSVEVSTDFLTVVKKVTNSYSTSNLGNVTTSNTIPAVVITSVPVSSSVTSISETDAVFDSSKAQTLVIGAYGCLGPNGAINQFGKRANIWGSDSQLYGSSITGYAGVALEVRFSNGVITHFYVRSKDRAEGINIIPVRDDTAKGSTITPYWPYCMIGLE